MILGGGGGAGKFYCDRLIVFSMSSARKFNFRYFDAKILIFIRNKIWKKKKKLIGGGGLDFLKREAGQDLHVIYKYFCKLVKYRYVHVHITYM